MRGKKRAKGRWNKQADIGCCCTHASKLSGFCLKIIDQFRLGGGREESFKAFKSVAVIWKALSKVHFPSFGGERKLCFPRQLSKALGWLSSSQPLTTDGVGRCQGQYGHSVGQSEVAQLPFSKSALCWPPALEWGLWVFGSNFTGTGHGRVSL